MATLRRLPLALLLGGCGGSPATVPLTPTAPAALRTTLEDLAMFGAKQVGTEAGHMAGEYVRGRMAKLGLADVHKETFAFPRHDLVSASAAFTVGGKGTAVGFDVFEASGSGAVDGPLVWVGSAAPAELAGKALAGKIALVERSLSYHRSTQYLNLVAAGAAGMVYVSAARDNLRQVGSLRRGWEASGPIPGLTIGAVDGKALRDALAAGIPARAKIDVRTRITPAEGDNIVGRIPGREAHQIVIGAHYDTWFAGSTDNGGGVAALLALAERRLRQEPPRYTLVFVAYDGEEVALYGGYDYLHKHRAASRDPILAVLNLEVPAALQSGALGLARSGQQALDDAIRGGGLNDLYLLYTDLDAVPAVFGGNIPTDIQGLYRSGVPTVTTAVDTPYYHTTQDTPDKVDLDFLAVAVDAFDLAVASICGDEPAAYAVPDPKLWRAAVTLRPRGAGEPLVVEVTVKDGAGALQAKAPVAASLLVDDFFSAGDQEAITDGAGRARFTFPGAAVERGAGHRFVHVTAGPRWPLVEEVVAVP